MSIINSQPLIGASGQGGAYNLTRSLRFRSSASAYLNRTVGSPTSQNKWTYSKWVKRGALGISGNLLSDTSAGSQVQYLFTSSDTLQFYVENSLNVFVTTQVFRDVSSWYHIVLAVDSAASGADKVKLYVNGSQVTAFSTDGRSSFSQSQINKSGATNTIGNYGAGTNHFDGYMAEVNFIDGQQLTPSSFGETDTATGVWKPKKYTGTYGTNGFYLKFDNLTSTSTLGNDSSGNSNTWTVNNISLTSGSTYDSMKDVPTLTDADTANYCTLNPVAPGDYFASGQSALALTNGNLNYGSTGRNAFGTMAVSSGKWYYEFSNTANTSSASTLSGLVTVAERASVYGVYYNSSNGYKGLGTLNTGATETSYGATWTDNDIIGVALDMDAATPTVTFYKNNSSQGSISVSSFASKSVMVWMQNGANSGNMSGWFNFGQRPFNYTPPTGYVALNTFNLPTPTIGATASTQANKYFDATTYTGTGSSLNITGLGFQPDLVWIKERNAAADHALYDAVRGVQKQLESNTTDAETTESTGLTAFNSDGFTVGALAQVNTNTDTYVAWNWDANGAGSTNTAGSQTSTVSVNTTAGFSIATFTCTGLNVNGTVGHGLGVAPNMIITKSRGSGSNWVVYHSSVSTDVNKFLRLNDTSALTTLSNVWGDALPTSTVFGIRGDVTLAASATAVAYCFAEVAGYSAFGSYTGNGSTDGPFVFTGFRPKYILRKRTDTTAYWVVNDSTRNPYNLVDLALYPNDSLAESSDNGFDILSNGFKIRSSGSNINASGGTYIYVAFAENPFKYSLAR